MLLRVLTTRGWVGDRCREACGASSRVGLGQDLLERSGGYRLQPAADSLRAARHICDLHGGYGAASGARTSPARYLDFRNPDFQSSKHSGLPPLVWAQCYDF